jgi:hypothetical protein
MAARALKPPRGKGRPKGSPNKVTATLKEAILATFDSVGGVKYLSRVALDDPRTFCALLGRVLPMTVNAVSSGEVKLTIVTGVPRDQTGDGNDIR